MRIAHTLTQEDLLKDPVYIEHRPIKDPRDIKILDPACGSGHFLLYAFGLLQTIYKEAWVVGSTPASSITGKTLREDYPTLQLLQINLPDLIIRHNLHGIDIDRRAIQIAALALWIRAQKAWRDIGLKMADRPRIRRSNVVCAEKMPGESDLLREFIATLKPTVLAQLVEVVFEKMKFAGEAGSLLKIEEEIRESVAEAKKQWANSPRAEQGLLFPVRQKIVAEQGYLFDVRGVTDDKFWSQAEEITLSALQEYSEQSANGQLQNYRLFADDAAQGFAFIDLCRQHYDVVLMNPPFGAFAQSADAILNQCYPNCRGDLYPCFMERWGARSELVGAITNRTGLTLSGLAPWRVSTLLTSPRLTLLVDLGIGVLDALVETAMFIIGKSVSGLAIAIDLLAIAKDKAKDNLQSECEKIKKGEASKCIYIRDIDALRSIPSSPICYRIPVSFIDTFAEYPRMERDGFVFRSTSPNYDDFRFMRLRWEVPPEYIGRYKRWSPLAKGGEYRPYYADIDLVIDWDENRRTFRGFTGNQYRPLERPACADLFFTPGLTWSGRTASRFSPRILPSGSIFSSKGPYAGGAPSEKLLIKLGIMMSTSFQSYLELFVQAGDATSSGSAARDYQVGALRNVPDPILNEKDCEIVKKNTANIILGMMFEEARDETCSLFFPMMYSKSESLAQILDLYVSKRVEALFAILAATEQIDGVVANAYRFGPEEIAYMKSLFGCHPLQYPGRDILDKTIKEMFLQDTEVVIRNAVSAENTGRFITIKGYYADRHLEVVSHILSVSPTVLRKGIVERMLNNSKLNEIARDYISLLLGIAFGRWDIGFAVGENITPELPDPFAPLLICPPGMLQNKMEQPLTKDDVHSLHATGQWNYPLEIPWDGIVVDDPGNSLDIKALVRSVHEVIWKERAEVVEREACEILDIKDMRDYFRKSGFFDDHLKRYSKSRRKAPIYWRLSTASGSYSIWIYFHRFTKDTFYKVLNEYINPKIEYEERALTSVRQEAGPMPSASQRKEIEARTEFLGELRAFRDEIARIAPLWNPDLNDGVIINYAPLWRLVSHHRAWQKDLKECWENLVVGDYDWSHLAMHVWPERVVPKCAEDLSLAIAHGLENVFWEKDAKEKWKKRKVSSDDVKRIVTERTSSSVKAALNDLLSASGSVENGKRTRKPRAKSTSKGNA